ncbi:MAG TPA: 2-amino-4-hydroxy-6-hydroxymethyldihydropteridine diphosphokinase [Leeuwenhoekiella sp.]|uniref:2-amino-4-hydroxy-6- hydroxymethyldihydropteridine diphosphokinase n=1 Tax=Leeuwenhoekiella palythoae TaxID=573501 RepID=UPI000C468FB0|nr:2-amino-4-hydroxy-6-hydroxymethyldihydropteridine diphosphokinase [Leeuwenhoekiella palythoae]MBH14017.1 2-amino-4-hydroxy-6-hydroxymethyldihydropteridine diphosphokinase [Leeuwenhoekiella sp.]UBZ12206.1 2-amino-4-hydroxy-6-hydroxymethyldihydropteridine diphosphokinase [Leeuwenhoekiella palythoae]HBO29515.1 2-amino-4-hydroxy-6-hydroxymethyldihydropteridine diphosphokinase [Leeuwenhoekiella sp.]HCQ76209.1 2-amino-4-hydroxy-6-hydroxymethyldihydropteridine diphosphokinase [Leeuwenhoekiella sp.]
MKPLQHILLSLGSNQGDSFENLQRAVDGIFQNIGSIKQLSPVYKTKAWGFEGADFLNCTLSATTTLDAEATLDALLAIEKQLGRERKEQAGYSDRPIDIDLLFYGDSIVETQKLSLPHPQLQKRNFVLFPLRDIAATFKHPLLKKSIEELTAETPDAEIPEKQSKWLKNPQAAYTFSTHNYIAIEGNIGAGKTTLATKISEDFNAKLILERFKDNPFLPKFYEDQARYAFPLEMSFLADRYQQLLDDIGQYDLFKDFMIADYDSQKSLIFAKVTLSEEEYSLYQKLHGIMYREIARPDLYVYLYQNTERLLENIKKRGRSYEQDISESYLIDINKGYLNMIKNKRGNNVKIIDISGLDFVENRADYLKVLDALQAVE